MAALVQSLPSPSTSTLTMLQARSSSSDAFQATPQSQQHQRSPQVPRNIYNTSVGGMAAGNYRGHTTASPVSPYAFQNMPVLQNAANPLRQHPTSVQNPRYENRTTSAPSLPVVQPQSPGSSSRPRPPPTNASPLPLNNATTFTPLQHTTSADDTSISNATSKHPTSRSLATLDLSAPSLQIASYANIAKSSPDRYRRNHRRAETAAGLVSNPPLGGSALPSGSGMATVGHLYTHPNQTSSTPTLSTYPLYRGSPSPNSQNSQDYSQNAHVRHASKDDIVVHHRQPSSEVAKRYRRRSISSLEVKDYPVLNTEAITPQAKPKTYAAMLASPAPSERIDKRGSATYERPTLSHGIRETNESGNPGSSGARLASVSLERKRLTWCNISSCICDQKFFKASLT